MNTELRRLSAEFLAARHTLAAFILGLVRDPHAAEDIFQEVWVRLAEAAESGRGPEIRDTARWCRGVARNLILHHWRDESRGKVVVDERLVDLAAQAFEEGSRAEGAGEPPERVRALGECLGALPEKSRDLLRLKYERGLSGEEAAALLRTSYEAIMASLSRIRRALWRCVKQKLRLAMQGGGRS